MESCGGGLGWRAGVVALQKRERERRNENNGGKQSNTEPYIHSMHVYIEYTMNACVTWITYHATMWWFHKNTSTNTSENEKLFSFLLLINSCHLYSVEFAAFKKLPNKLFALRSRSNKAHLRNLYIYVRCTYILSIRYYRQRVPTSCKQFTFFCLSEFVFFFFFFSWW